MPWCQHLVGMRALRLLLGPGLDEALGVVVVDAGAQIVVAGGDLVALGQRLVAAALDHVAERAPFLQPGLAAISLALSRAQLLAAAVDLAQRDDAIGRHALQDQRGVRPQKIVVEVVDPGAAIGHSGFLRVMTVFAKRVCRRCAATIRVVMPGLVRGIHVFLHLRKQDVDGRDIGEARPSFGPLCPAMT